MTTSRLLSIEIERFKSYQAPTRVELKPLTVLVGRNNCGKSSIIQALLLLRQTVNHASPNVPLVIDGEDVQATSLRELT